MNAPSDTSIAGLPLRVWRIFHDDATDWCEGRSAAVRAPLWLFLLYVCLQQWWDPAYWSLFNFLNLAIHEGGHLLFRFGGDFICVAGGTILQLFAPLASMVMFLKQRDYFAIAVCFAWLSTNLFGVALYMADADDLALDLVTVGDGEGGITHDWQYMFIRMGMIRHCDAIGWLTRQAGNLSMLVGLILGAWLMWRMFRSTASAPRNAGI
jgi:hypothetical protein